MAQSLVTVDAGNLLFKNPLSDVNGRDNTTALIAAHGIVRAYEAMSYDAVAVSFKDLSAGTVFFREASMQSFPWVSANAFDENNHLLFLPHIIKKIPGLTIGIIGLTGGEEASSNTFIITDWRKALAAEIKLLEKNCDMLVVLSNLTAQENDQLQQDFNQIDIVISGDKKGSNIRPKLSHNSLLVQSGARGKYIGKLDITWFGHGDWLGTSSQKPNFNFSILPVKPTTTEGDIGNIVQDIKNNIHTYNQYRRSQLHLDDSALRQALQKDEITGISACAKCHKKQTDFWKTTRHANAYATLSQQGQSFNLQCLACHVTAGKVNASSDNSQLIFLLSLDSDRQTIGCEVCHGPGKQHLLSPEELSPVRLPSEEICIQCHTADRDSNFVYQEKLTAIACPAD